jgi:hypothetical protein
MANDPFPPVINAISAVLAKPSGPPYQGGLANPPDPVLAATVTGLVNVLYGASADMKSVGAAMATAFETVAKVLSALADKMQTLSSLTDKSTMGQLQSTLEAAVQQFAPNIPPVDPNSLPSQIQGLLNSGQTPANAANELYELVQQLNLIAHEIRPQ